MAFVDTIVAAFAADASVGAIAAGVAAVGTDMSVVGAVTGNKTLAEVGGVLGLAGGAVGLASDVIGGVGSTAATVGSDAGYAAQSDTAMFKAAGADPIAAPLDPAAVATQSSIASQNIANATNAANGAADGAAAPSMDQVNTLVGAPAEGTPQVAGGIGAAPNGDQINTLMGQTGSQASDIGSDAIQGSETSGAGTSATAASQPAGDSQNAIGAWLNGLDPQTRSAVIRTAGQGIAGMVGGLFNGWTQEQKLALAQQQQNFAQQQYATAMKNASAPVYLPSSYRPAAAQAPAQPGATGLLQTVSPSNT